MCLCKKYFDHVFPCEGVGNLKSTVEGVNWEISGNYFLVLGGSIDADRREKVPRWANGRLRMRMTSGVTIFRWNRRRNSSPPRFRALRNFRETRHDDLRGCVALECFQLLIERLECARA